MPTTSNKPTRAAIYARVSEQDTGMQVAELRQVCGQRAEHLDDGVSGVASAHVRGSGALRLTCGAAAEGARYVADQ
jgi:hypothetical protein